MIGVLSRRALAVQITIVLWKLPYKVALPAVDRFPIFTSFGWSNVIFLPSKLAIFVL
jgi:hypothetical protein